MTTYGRQEITWLEWCGEAERVLGASLRDEWQTEYYFRKLREALTPLDLELTSRVQCFDEVFFGLRRLHRIASSMFAGSAPSEQTAIKRIHAVTRGLTALLKDRGLEPVAARR